MLRTDGLVRESVPAWPREITAARGAMVAFLVVVVAREGYWLPALTPAKQMAVVGCLIALCAAWSWFWWRIAAQPDRPWQGIAFLVVTIAATSLVVVNPVGISPMYYAAIIAGAAYQWRVGLFLVPIVTALTLGASGWSGNASLTNLQVGVIAALLGGGALTVRRYVGAQLDLAHTRDELRRLAVSEARYQLARDMHDQLGQQLTATVMIGELLALDVADDQRSAVRERSALLVTTAREALEMMRQLVTEVPEPTLHAELLVAASLLGAAGIACTVANHADDLPWSVDVAFAWTVREATANVMRHSNASECGIEVSQADGCFIISVTDDGVGRARKASGNGIRHCRERLAVVGGRVEITEGSTGGFRLCATAPVRA